MKNKRGDGTALLTALFFGFFFFGVVTGSARAFLAAGVILVLMTAVLAYRRGRHDATYRRLDY